MDPFHNPFILATSERFRLASASSLAWRLMSNLTSASSALATAIAGHARSSLLHMGFEGRVSTAGNLAFPFSPQDIPAGPVYAFSAYHLVEDPEASLLFPVYTMPVGAP